MVARRKELVLGYLRAHIANRCNGEPRKDAGGKTAIVGRRGRRKVKGTEAAEAERGNLHGDQGRKRAVAHALRNVDTRSQSQRLSIAGNIHRQRAIARSCRRRHVVSGDGAVVAVGHRACLIVFDRSHNLVAPPLPFVEPGPAKAIAKDERVWQRPDDGELGERWEVRRWIKRAGVLNVKDQRSPRVGKCDFMVLGEGSRRRGRHEQCQHQRKSRFGANRMFGGLRHGDPSSLCDLRACG